MTSKFEDRFLAYMNAIRGIMNLDRVLNGAILIAEVKANNRDRELSKEEAYEAMLVVADKLRTNNPFDDIDSFYQMYMQMEDVPDWEQLLYNGLRYDRAGSILVPDALLSVMK